MSDDAKLSYTQRVILAVVGGTGTVVAAVIGGCVLYLRANPEPAKPQAADSAKPRLELRALAATLQPVNQKFSNMESKTRVGGANDTGTIRYRVTNSGDSDTRIDRAAFIVDDVEALEDLGSTLIMPTQIEHNGHIRVQLGRPEVGDAVPVQLNLDIPADASREFTLWFQASESADLYFVTGRLRLYVGDQTFTSKKLEMEIHTETNGWDWNKSLIGG